MSECSAEIDHTKYDISAEAQAYTLSWSTLCLPPILLYNSTKLEEPANLNFTQQESRAPVTKVQWYSPFSWSWNCQWNTFWQFFSTPFGYLFHWHISSFYRAGGPRRSMSGLGALRLSVFGCEIGIFPNRGQQGHTDFTTGSLWIRMRSSIPSMGQDAIYRVQASAYSGLGLAVPS